MSRRGTAAVALQLPLLDAAELHPASSACQRWSQGMHSWRRRRDGGFDRRLYAACRIDNTLAKRYVERHHYLHSSPAVRLSWGLYQGDQLLGVALLGVPSHEAVLTNVFPELAPCLNQCIPSTHWCCTSRHSRVGLPSDHSIDLLAPILSAMA